MSTSGTAQAESIFGIKLHIVYASSEISVGSMVWCIFVPHIPFLNVNFAACVETKNRRVADATLGGLYGLRGTRYTMDQSSRPRATAPFSFCRGEHECIAWVERAIVKPRTDQEWFGLSYERASTTPTGSTRATSG